MLYLVCLAVFKLIDMGLAGLDADKASVWVK
jgi:hypothetical protein